jgi:hypothetical protein
MRTAAQQLHGRNRLAVYTWVRNNSRIKVRRDDEGTGLKVRERSLSLSDDERASRRRERSNNRGLVLVTFCCEAFTTRARGIDARARDASSLRRFE